MKRLIYADELKSDILSKMHLAQKEYLHKSHITHQIDIAPTVDAVEVVRCKDCRSFERKCAGLGYCYTWDYDEGLFPNEVEDNDFCSYGERRTDGSN